MNLIKIACYLALLLGTLVIKPDLELDHVRTQINVMLLLPPETGNLGDLSSGDFESEMTQIRPENNANQMSAEWCFVDCKSHQIICRKFRSPSAIFLTFLLPIRSSLACTAERFFRIDRAQEHLHYVVDICNDDLYILDATEEVAREDGLTNCLSEADPTLNVTQSRSSFGLLPPAGEDNNNTIVLLKTNSKDSVEGKRSEGDDDSSYGLDYDGEVNGNRTEKSDSLRDDLSPARDLSSKELFEEIRNDEEQRILCKERIRDHEFLEAAKAGDLVGLKRLHEDGSSLTTAEANGMTSLHYAARNGFEHIVQFLLKESHALMDLCNDEGQTALHEAAKFRRQRICGMLAVAGCLLSKTDNQGLTAKELALKAGDEHLSAYLDRKSS